MKNKQVQFICNNIIERLFNENIKLYPLVDYLKSPNLFANLELK